ncbi:MAG: GTPase ObgE [Mycoplasma sp.]|nr:GTPase ObgE [Mycoplasma sp.]
MMKFIDEAKIHVKAGKGGNGMISFRREAHVAKGGPDGGDGGRGGHVYFLGDPGMNTLFNLKMKRNFFANNGEDGRRKNQYGAKGKDIYVKVPMGTLLINKENLLFDISSEKPILVASGGNGGRGNTKFKTSRNQAPRISENGDKGLEYKELTLNLKVLADVGFVGKPSAGKSTLLSKLTNAKPKVASYEFTTLNPQLGISHIDDNSFVIADLPGLIEGAAKGKGLGINFLKHIERCKVIAHVIDFGEENKKPIDDYKIINSELKEYSLGLEKRRQVVIANKNDSIFFKQKIKEFKKEFPEIELIEISALEEKGLKNLKYKLYDAYITAAEIEYKAKKSEVTITFEDDFIVEKEYEGLFEVYGKEVERIYEKIPVNTSENFMRFNRALKELGVWKELRDKGIENGDTVRIFGFEFEWSERD